uniref:Arf-GAP domain-containing protein n=1 Tax=Arcella intermedia TaxID=1963864 RepID=A0A6B2L595_9EUKA
MICLDCAGKHRGLGVHLSFVRSIEMDTWNNKQLLSMKYGGNVACREFFQRYGIDDYPLSQKYDTPVAHAYKAKIEALVEKRPWTDPTFEEIKKFRSNTGSITPRSQPLNTSGKSLAQNQSTSPTYSNPPSYSTQPKYGNFSGLSSDDYFRGGKTGYQDPYYISPGNHQFSGGRNKGDLDRFVNDIQSTGQKGFTIALDYLNKAKQIVGDGYSNLDRNASLLGHGSMGSSSGGGFSSSNPYSTPGSYNSSFNAAPTTDLPKSSPVYPASNPKPASAPATRGRSGARRGRGGRKPTSKPVSKEVPVKKDDGWDLSAWEDELQDTEPSSNETPISSEQQIWDADLWGFAVQTDTKKDPETEIQELKDDIEKVESNQPELKEGSQEPLDNLTSPDPNKPDPEPQNPPDHQ